MNDRIVRSWKAVIVVTRNDGIEPDLGDLEILMKKYGLAYGMPGQPEAPIVISINDGGSDLPIREKVIREDVKNE